MKDISIIASVLGADFSRLGDECQALEQAGVDAIQWDVMDGQFVPNLTMGPDIIKSARPFVEMDFEAHLMVLDPAALAERYVDAGCMRIIIHKEACQNLGETLSCMGSLGVELGLAINPDTPAADIEQFLDLVDMVLVMTVNPGFGGQAFIESTLPKIGDLKNISEKRSLDLDIEVDGGIGAETIPQVVKAGANLLVSGSALYKFPGGLSEAVKEFKDLAEKAS